MASHCFAKAHTSSPGSSTSPALPRCISQMEMPAHSQSKTQLTGEPSEHFLLAIPCVGREGIRVRLKAERFGAQHQRPKVNG